MSKTYILIFTFILSFSVSAKRVLIDPGHGGEDCGAKAKLWQNKRLVVICEKDIALAIAKKVKTLVNKSNRHTAYLTRTIDKELDLDKRSKLADTIKADIFVSIHLNAATIKSSNGFETYYLDNHKDEVIKKVERAENRNGSNGQEMIVNNILTDLIIERVAPKSKELGQAVHSKLTSILPKKYKMSDRGLKPGMFYVLALSKRPAILIEVGFLTNENEAKLTISGKFQDQFAKSVADGILAFLDKNSEPNLF
ncbi:N-acetylmuramoyl-L-alanine amidase [Bacteriovorax sp. Seq25_V]|uniref:N-acetylmuramoyl-L-alanine amidase family protein n=1 Tax=Bacteriovorax sp. Seq25_V TaxID=1201288 RepID=UPI00038A265E|nr:N-acetylmuramoyl-L-alanine amidase [Bacteriovorax sp. Seq25_V]EQC44218.1 N-acetylmuramoyl-L-alanine amidase [Bacteriovorax sp. Seq25_V]